MAINALLKVDVSSSPDRPTSRLKRIHRLEHMTSRSSSALRKSTAPRKPGDKTSAAKTKVGKLPEWDLADLYSGIDAPEVMRDLQKMDADCVAFETDFKGKLSEQTAEEGGGKWLAGAVRRYEAIDELAGRLGSYAGLVHAGDSVRSGDLQILRATCPSG